MNDDRDAYCREVEAYLCRRNGGHLVRVVGPAFELVRGWSERGIPLKVVFSGIDRQVERYLAKGPQRRPVRIEFCEADVLDVFDEWRRAVGVAAADQAAPDAADAAEGRRESMAAHLERSVARLTARRAGADRALDTLLDAVVRELDAEKREALLERLRALDGELQAAAQAACDAATLRRLTEEADLQLAPFRPRMAAAAYAQSRQACLDRLIREHAKLPTLAFD